MPLDAHLSPVADLAGRRFNIPPEPTIDNVRVRAYERFLERAGGPGSAEQDWLEAERDIRERSWDRG
jgi:hypothetical protein